MNSLTAGCAQSAILYGGGTFISELSDETIEDLFPPSEEDLAELRTLEDHLSMLAFMEEMEEEDASWRLALSPGSSASAPSPRRWAERRKDQVEGVKDAVLDASRLERILAARHGNKWDRDADEGVVVKGNGRGFVPKNDNNYETSPRAARVGADKTARKPMNQNKKGVLFQPNKKV